MGNVINGRQADIIEIITRDYTGAKIDSWRCSIEDKERVDRIMKIVREKYGLKAEEGVGKTTDWLSTESEFLKF